MDNTSMREALEAARDLLLPQCNGGTAFAKACGETVNKIMDALKDERTSDGNAAALREALLIVKRLFDGRIMFQPAIRKAHKAVDAALAAPPRNCDRFGGDIDKLREACARERGLNPEEDFPDVFPDWLLALAKESGVRK